MSPMISPRAWQGHAASYEERKRCRHAGEKSQAPRPTPTLAWLQSSCTLGYQLHSHASTFAWYTHKEKRTAGVRGAATDKTRIRVDARHIVKHLQFPKHLYMYTTGARLHSHLYSDSLLARRASAADPPPSAPRPPAPTSPQRLRHRQSGSGAFSAQARVGSRASRRMRDVTA